MIIAVSILFVNSCFENSFLYQGFKIPIGTFCDMANYRKLQAIHDFAIISCLFSENRRNSMLYSLAVLIPVFILIIQS